MAFLAVASLHDDWAFGFIAQRMICSGVPLDEPFLQHCLVNLESSERTKLKEGRIPVNESFYLMGTADPTGVLHYDEVCVILYVKVLFLLMLSSQYLFPWAAKLTFKCCIASSIF